MLGKELFALRVDKIAVRAEKGSHFLNRVLGMGRDASEFRHDYMPNAVTGVVGFKICGICDVLDFV